MSTIKKRINISIAKPLEMAVERLAARDQMPTASKAADLIRLAVEMEEDQVWDTIASRRDVKAAQFVSHKKAWA
ncbi:MAG: hypothetical protein HZC03_01230 [Candidatus Lloydbacteria bacterium]|nr:hypothetical protein [Candidatus Lloydbacteria bacterium]